MKRSIVLTFLFLLFTLSLPAQQDSRYDSGKNLPFNRKAGDVDPQTGNVTLQITDLSLPGRAGMDFSFGRIWKTNQANVFSMSRDPVDGSNRLSSDTIEDINHLGAGWSTDLPYILIDEGSGSRVMTLFHGGGAYEIDQTGIRVRNLNKSNLLWYDLLDKRVYEDSSKAYSDGPVTVSSLSAYQVADKSSDRSRYELLLKDNSRCLFREDGRLMTRIDKSGLNEIWYYYDSQSRLAAVVDSIGRVIRFSYNANGNLETIEWDVRSYVLKADGTREEKTETRSIGYTYKAGSSYSAISSLTGLVTDYKAPYALESMTDPMGHVTKYVYEAKKASFSYESRLSHWQNASLLLTGIRNYVDDADKALSERRFEYAIPAKGMYTKYFYGGYMEYFKVSREYGIDRSGREVGDTRYIYHDNNEAGNFNRYTAVVQTGGVTQTYTYTVSSNPSENDVLDSLSTESSDGYREEKDYVYNAERVKTLEETFRQGQFVFREKFLYDLKGNLKEHTDKMGLVTVKQYDDTYSIPVKETRIFSSAGEEKQYNLERSLTDLGQVTEEILYTAAPIEDSRALITSYDYDAYGNRIKTTDPAGGEVHTVFDTTHHAFPVRSYQMASEESYSNTSSSDYWFSRPDQTNQVKLGGWTAYNSDGSLWLEVDGEGYAVEHYYDALGSEIAVVSPDEDDVLLGDQDINDIKSHSSFASFLSGRQNNPRIRTAIDYESAYVKTIADFEYDSLSSSWSTLESAVQQDGVGNVTEEISYKENGQVYGVKKMVYDPYGRMIALTDPDAGSSYSSIQVNGETVKRYDKTWLIRYDDMGRQLKVLYPDTGNGTKIKRMSYDDAKNAVSTTDPEGSVLYEQRDWNDNVVLRTAYGNSSTDASGIQSYRFSYDALNRMTESIDPEGLVTGYRFDERDLLVEQIYGNGSDTMVYDKRGLLTSKSDRKGQKILFIYDEAGRNTRSDYYDKDNSLSDTEYRQYDRRGHVIRVENKDLIERCLFDGAGRLAGLDRRLKDMLLRNSVSTVYGGNQIDQVFSFGYEYTASGLLNRMSYPDGAVHSFSYDQYLGFLTGIGEGSNQSSIAPFITNLDYSKSGVVTRMEGANGTSQLWDFDNRKRISRIRISNGSSYIEDLNYRIDGSGNILSINDNRYRYDGFHRIIGADTKLPEIPDSRALVESHFGSYEGGEPVEGKVYAEAADLFPENEGDGRINGADFLQALIDLEEASADGFLPYDRESFSYDRNGNRTKLVQNGDEYTYSYGIRNRLEKIELKTDGSVTKSLYAEFTYDKNGNTISRTIHGKEGTETVGFEYDVLNRLVKTTRGSESTSYLYDNAGNRVVKSSSDGSIDLYLRHGTIAVGMDIEVNADQSEEKGRINRYVLSGDLVAGKVSTSVKADDSKEVSKSFYHLDHLNSTKVVTDADGEVVVNYTYRAFGEQLKRLDKDKKKTEDAGKYSYSGKELDEDINLYYFNARFYDATTGRFINVDPIQDGSNWYVYCSNNPLSFVDPTGLFALGAAIGFVTSSVAEIAGHYENTGNGLMNDVWDATKNTFTSGESLAVIGASTAIGALTSGASALATKSAIGATKAGGMLLTSAARSSTEIIAKTAAINSTSALIGSAASDVMSRDIKGQGQNPVETLKTAGSSALFAAGTSTVSQGIIAYNSAKIGSVNLTHGTSPSPTKVAMPTWSSGFGAATEGVIPAAESAYDNINSVVQGNTSKENN